MEQWLKKKVEKIQIKNLKIILVLKKWYKQANLHKGRRALYIYSLGDKVRLGKQDHLLLSYVTTSLIYPIFISQYVMHK